MNIGINTLVAGPGKGGAKTYITNIVESLSEIDDQNNYFLFTTPENEKIFQKALKKDNFKEISLSFTQNKILRILAEQLLLPFLIKKNEIDVLFSPWNIGTLFPPCKQIITIHDLHHKFTPMKKIRKLYCKTMLSWSASKSDKIIVPSLYTKKTISENLECGRKIKVVKEGPGQIEKATKKKDQKYILFVGSLAKKMNEKLTKEFFDYIKPRYLKKFHVLKEYMKKAKAFVFAAKEDFGIVPVEAQACGTLVIAYEGGGNLETVKKGVSGIFFKDQTTESLIKAVGEFESKNDKFSPKEIRKNAETFGKERFRNELNNFIDKIIGSR